MTKTKRVTMLILAAVTLLVFGATAVYGANALTVKAYPGVTIFYNGKQLTDDQQPLIINDYTYVPLRMVMENFGKSITWDGATQRVLISDSLEEAQQQADLINLQNENKKLQATIDQLNATIADLQKNKKTSSTSNLKDIEDTLNDYFDDAGYDYFSDKYLSFTITLSGDEDDIAYLVRVDCRDSSKYDDIRDLSKTKVEDFLDDLEAKLLKEIDRTDYEDADITGEMKDRQNSRYYVKYNGRTYSYNWSSGYTSEKLSDIADEVEDYFADAGEDYFADDGIRVYITLSGDEDEIDYSIKLDFRYADYSDDLTELSKSRIESFMNAVKNRISREIDGTDFEDADIIGELRDYSKSSYYVEYNGSRYYYSF